jgi:DNA-binding GntR family transcriptional regulator
MRLYRPCNRPKLLKMIEDIVRGIDIHLRALQSSAVGRKAPQVEHRDILAACAERDALRATRLLQEHIDHTRAALAA